MIYNLHYASAWTLYFTLPLIALCAFFRIYYKKPTVYRFSRTDAYAKIMGNKQHLYQQFFLIIRIILCILLALIIARPQLVDVSSKISVDGIDIVLALDVSGSMQYPNSARDECSRFTIAQEEAIRFIQKRTNDAIGLVLFAGEAVTRCPITLDKKVVGDVVRTVKIGDLDPNKTMLASGLLTALNRLKQSHAKSKVVILLTDGEPSPGDLPMATALEVAKKLGIKVYAIGIGSEDLIANNLFHVFTIPKVNEQLLEQVAKETGGQCFMAHNAQDMRKIYDTIDTLETVRHEAPLFSSYYDLYILGICILAGIIGCELLLTTFIWYGI